MELDNLLLGELNHRSARYRNFKVARLSQEGLGEVQRLDLKWIRSTCESKGYDTGWYLDYYHQKI